VNDAILLDTDVLSLTRRPERQPELMSTLLGYNPTRIFISAITLMEIERGIEGQRRHNPAFASDLSEWRDQLRRQHARQFVSFDEAAGLETGRLIHKLGYMSADLQIAGIALSRGMAVATLNRRHFEPTGCRIVSFE
jgi:predicted nucleic acid-binding protein